MHENKITVFSQNKYMSVMRDKAELSDKADELEHTVLQLQGESETIGRIEIL